MRKGIVGKTAIIAGLLGVAVAAIAATGRSGASEETIAVTGRIATSEETVAAASPAAAPETEGAAPGLTFTVEPELTPAAATVPGIGDGDAPRPVGRLLDEEGHGSDIVLGELIVTVDDPSQLDGFLVRWKGEVVQKMEGGGRSDYLVRVPPIGVDTTQLVADLTAVEAGHEGEYQVSDDRLLTLLAIAASEKEEHGVDVALNWLSTPLGIADGDVKEAADLNNRNPFEWSFLRVGGNMDTGVAGAWQLLHHYGKLDQTIPVMIVDGGFFENADFPNQRKIRQSSWDTANPSECSGGNACPWHGTDVALTAVGKVGNEFGTAGVAGPVGELIAVQIDADFWTKMRRTKDMVDQERPAVVNMSFSWEVKLFRNATQSAVDRHLGDMKDMGALVFASAGNDGKDVDGRICQGNNCYENRLIVPCESKHAVCVGGVRPNSAWLDPGSNYGTAGGSRSVQIYAPFCTISLFNPIKYDDTTWVCGTSFSSPFVAGAAALVKAADPSLTPDEIWGILRDTAHVGGVHFDYFIPTEHQLRINVLDAVAAALGVEQSGPSVTITSPGDGAEVSVADWLDLTASAIDFKGQPLPVSWESSLDGDLGTAEGPLSVWDLSTGKHTVTARAGDVNGEEGSDSIVVTVVDLPPEMGISWPAPNSVIYDTEDLVLVGSSEDPDTYQPLPNGDVEWELIRNGQVVHGAAGHVVEVPGNTLQPGSYDIVFRGYQGGGIGEAETILKVIAVPEGETVPTAIITTQFSADPYGAYNGKPQPFTLNGVGTDNEDGQLSGTRFRWIARADNGHEEILCTGSSFQELEAPDEDGFNPGFAIQPPPQPKLKPLVILTDCASVDVELGLAPGAMGATVWTIVLEVSDSAGLVGQDFADVTVAFVTG